MDTLFTDSDIPVEPPTWGPPQVPAPPPSRRRWPRVAATSIALAALVGGGAGYLGASVAGEVIGMNSAGAASSGTVTAENIGFAISINEAMTIVTQLRAAA